MYDTYKITKPIRLIELFAGYGSQLFALKYLGANVSSHKIVEWAVPSIQAYKDAHFHDRNDDHTSNKTFDDLVDELLNYGISGDYNKPMTRQQIVRKGLKWCKQVYNNIKNTNNLVNIMNVKGKDLEITETDKYDYILTYSFPCQDLSLAGKRAGMDEDSGTRSGLLWEVERILKELNELGRGSLPQVLLMENVPQVISQDNMRNMEKWDEFLSSLGYKSYIKNLIATDYGIPQIRNRTFMISILGDYSYTFPKPMPLELKLSDMLEDDIDEKYFLSDKQISDINNWKAYQKPFETMKQIEKTGNSPTITTRTGAYAAGMILVDETAGKEREVKEYKNYGSWENGNVVVKDTRNLKEKLCDELIESKILKVGDVINHSYTNSGKNPNSRLSFEDFIETTDGTLPTLTTRGDILGVVVKEEYQGMYQYSKSDKFMQGKDIFTKNKELADTILTTQKEGVVVKNTATNTHDLRIRKLTPKECFRLMGVKDEDYDKIAKNQSDSSLYHLAGDSIVVNVLMAIFKQLL